ncbi:hypothetical protein ACWFR5_17540 [Streptomyces sp. NPDC055092]
MPRDQLHPDDAESDRRVDQHGHARGGHSPAPHPPAAPELPDGRRAFPPSD